MNCSHIIGRLTKDPDMRYTPNNIAATKFIVAINEKVNGKDDVNFIPVVVYGKKAEDAAKYLTKGSFVAITGKIKTRTYTKENVRMYFTEIKADYVQYLESKSKPGIDDSSEVGIEDNSIFNEYLDVPVYED